MTGYDAFNITLQEHNNKTQHPVELDVHHDVTDLFCTISAVNLKASLLTLRETQSPIALTQEDKISAEQLQK